MQSTVDFANTPVVDIVNKIIVDSARAGVSDIHFDHTDECLKVRIRIDGILNDYMDIPNNVKNNVITRIKILSGMNITETRLPQYKELNIYSFQKKTIKKYLKCYLIQMVLS